ncbi:MAG: selenocysteine-specific translation elongation factor [Acidimicrobiales bacterium]
MHVIATAGHVDHGKSTLVRALTGMEPDRWEEERHRGLTLDLGFAWTRLEGEDVAIVDVPGHERFVPTMLSGVGPVPAVLFVVAADDGWKPQSQEHLDILDALGVRHGLLVISRCDLADPGPALAQAREQMVDTSLDGMEAMAVSGVTGSGMAQLRVALLRLVRSLPTPDRAAAVRLWVDRSFTIRGAGTVVTGTLPAGTLHAGDRLALPWGREATVRRLHALGQPAQEVPAVARVGVNLRGVAADDVRRGDALTTPSSHLEVDVVDVRLSRPVEGGAQRQRVLHVGTAQVPVQVRTLGDAHARISLGRPLPLRIGDRCLLRDPGRHRVDAGLVVLDVDPPKLVRRGDGRRRAEQLGFYGEHADPVAELQRRRLVRRVRLVAMGVPPADVDAVRSAVDDPVWLLDPETAEELRARLSALVAEHAAASPLQPGLPVDVACQRLGLPEARLVSTLVAMPLVVRHGRVHAGPTKPPLPPEVDQAVQAVLADLASAPWAAPETNRLRELGLGPRELAATVRRGALTRVADGIYLAPGAVEAAAQRLRALPQPFAVTDARQAWRTTRRVAIPLLELLDRRAFTRRLPDGLRVVTAEVQ